MITQEKLSSEEKSRILTQTNQILSSYKREKKLGNKANMESYKLQLEVSDKFANMLGYTLIFTHDEEGEPLEYIGMEEFIPLKPAP